MQLAGIALPLYCATLAFLVQWLAFIPSYAKQTEKFYDLMGGVTFISVIGFLLAYSPDLDARKMLLAAMVMLWALRLGSFLFLRILKDGSDGRFDAIKPDFQRLLVTWTLQGVWVIVTASCAVAAIASNTQVSLNHWDTIAIAIWSTGMLIEIAADFQKRQFKNRHSDESGLPFISTGLWRYSRHPNYFGEIMLWVGVALLALPVLQGWQNLTLISPLLVYLLITKVSGIPLLEAQAEKKWGDNSDFIRYQRDTSRLIPLPSSFYNRLNKK